MEVPYPIKALDANRFDPWQSTPEAAIRKTLEKLALIVPFPAKTLSCRRQ
ncbi:MAG TPA: hypothetical protein VIN67_02030 [Desulfobaccales bacterium]